MSRPDPIQAHRDVITLNAFAKRKGCTVVALRGEHFARSARYAIAVVTPDGDGTVAFAMSGVSFFDARRKLVLKILQDAAE